jgi:Zn finger protein HypA/HybF involved in hydrogenase expression
MKMKCVQCETTMEVELLEPTMEIKDGSITMLCPFCRGNHFEVVSHLECSDCKKSDFTPIDASIENCKHYQCPYCGSPKLKLK